MKQDHSYHFNQQYIAALDHYFEHDPYKAWYNSAFEGLLNGLDASFYSGKENTALHTDICAPLATNPTWEGLSKEAKETLEIEGVKLWHHLVDYLQPDIILISVAGEHLNKIQFETIQEWETIYTLQKDRRYLINSKKVKLNSNKTTTIYFGRAAELPFGMVSEENKQAIGKYIKTLTEKSKHPTSLKSYLHSVLQTEQNDSDLFDWNQEAN
jgi:hypothetical protein